MGYVFPLSISPLLILPPRLFSPSPPPPPQLQVDVHPDKAISRTTPVLDALLGEYNKSSNVYGSKGLDLSDDTLTVDIKTQGFTNFQIVLAALHVGTRKRF